MNKKEKQKQISQMSQEAVQHIRNSFNRPEDIKELTEFMSHFNHYSLRNQALIQKQFRGARAVESFKFFNDHGFRIRKGEKAIRILAPSEYKTVCLENGKNVTQKYWTKEIKEGIKEGKYNVQTHLTYVSVPVYDILQTTAKPEDLPKLFPNRPFNFDFSNVKNRDQLFESLVQLANQHHIPVRYASSQYMGASKGQSVTSVETQEQVILLSNRLSKEEQIPTLIHEITHAFLHQQENRTDYSRAEKEFQAEFCSYLTCHQFGIDTSEKAFPYIAQWTKNLSELSDEDLLEQLNLIEKTSTYITDQVMALSNGQLIEKTAEQLNDSMNRNQEPHAPLDINEHSEPEIWIDEDKQNNVQLEAPTTEKQLKQMKETPISQLAFKMNQNHYVLVTNRQLGEFSLINRGDTEHSIPPFRVSEPEREGIMKQLDQAGYLPMDLESYKEMERQHSQHRYPTQLDYHFLNDSNLEHKHRFKAWNMDYNPSSGLLNQPFISIEWSSHPTWHEGMVLSFEEMKQQFNQKVDESQEEDYDKIKLNLHVTPNEYYQTFVYLSQEEGHFETQLEEKWPHIMQELELSHTLQSVTEELSQGEDWENIQVKTTFKGHDFTYNIQVNDVTQDIKGTYTRDHEQPREATPSACISALKYVIDHHEMDADQQRMLQNVVQDNEHRLERQAIYEANQSALDERFHLNRSSNVQEQHHPSVAHDQGQTTSSSWEKALDYARSVNILEVAQGAGIQLKREGKNQYRDANNHSMVFTPSKNSYYENNGQFGGDPIHFVQHVIGVSDFKDAVQYLNQQHYGQVDVEAVQHKEPYHYDASKESNDFSRAFHYLTKERGIKPELVKKLNEAGLIRQDKRNNVLFLWNDGGKVVGCTEQGTIKMKEPINGRTHWKGIQRNSESHQGFNFGTGQPKHLKFFESPIDALSYVSLHGLEKDTRYMSMDGLKENTVTQTILKASEKTGKHIESVQLCVDQDEAGTAFIQKFNHIKQFDSEGNEVFIKVTGNQPVKPQEVEKWDWNNELRSRQQKQAEKKQSRQQGSDLEL